MSKCLHLTTQVVWVGSIAKGDRRKVLRCKECKTEFKVLARK